MSTSTDNTIHIKPARAGLIVRDPASGRPLDPDGEHKPRNKYWLNRLRDVDVVHAPPPKPGKKTTQPSSASSASPGDN